MNDLTLLYVSANLIPGVTQNKIINKLPASYPIIFVTQQPLSDWYTPNILWPVKESSPYNYYKQVLEGCYYAHTEFVAIVEDDTLYNAEHFTHRPSEGFNYAYNTNTWLAGNKTYWQSSNMNSFGFYICRRKALISLLEDRFMFYPEAPSLLQQRHFHEPGVFEFDKPVKTCHFSTKEPLLAFEHRGTLSGKRKRFSNPGIESLEPYGNAYALYKAYWP